MRSLINLNLPRSSKEFTRFTLTLVVASLGSVFTTELVAQADDEVVVQEGRSERFQVTGSHIKRIDIEGPSPVSVLDRDFIDRSGGSSVADILRENNASSFGGFKEQAGSNAAGVAHVSLRGLGSTRTLVLLDGRRLPADAVTGAVDLNLIPLAAVERIEILKDGASATYGSDALGGVVNIITRPDYSGSEVTVKQHTPELKGGGKTEVSLVGGSATARTSVNTVLNYRRSEMVWDRDRSWSEEGISILGSPGSYQEIGESQGYADPNCPADRVVERPNGSFCTYNFATEKSMLPEMENVGLLTSFRHSVTDDLDFFARLGATRSIVEWVYAPAPGTFRVPGSVAATLGEGGGPLPGIQNTDNDVLVRYRLTELGNRVSQVETNSFNVLAGLSGTIAHHWDWEIAAQENRIKRVDLGAEGYAVTSTLSTLIEEGTFNPFAPEGERGDLSSAKFEPWEEAVTHIKQYDGKISGELFAMGGGHAAVAFGAATSHETFKNRLDSLSENGLAFGSAGSSGGGGRKTISFFSELALPVTEMVELQLAARHDDYSDFGNSTNPKAAIRIQPMPELLIRASVGTGFKAPSLTDLYAANSEGYPSFTDAVACDVERTAQQNWDEQAQADLEAGVIDEASRPSTPSCTEAQYLVRSGGNEDLKEEKSFSYNIGVLYQPNPNFSIGLDYWDIELDNVVGLSLGDLTEAELAGVDVSRYGIEVNRTEAGYIDAEAGVVAPLLNLASRHVSGLDLNLELGLLAVADGNLRFSSEHTHLLFYKEEGFPGTGYENKLGENGLPQWRNTSSLGFFSPSYEVSLTSRTIAGQEKNDADMGHLATYTEYDVHYGHNLGWNARLLFGVKNLLGATPPLDDSTPSSQLNQTLYDQVGRTFYAGYSQTM